MKAKDDIRRAPAIGYRLGRTYGALSPRVAESELRRVGIAPNDAAVTACCCGSEDGERGDDLRAIAREEPGE